MPAPTQLTTCEVLENTVSVAAGNETEAYTDNNEASATIEVQCGKVEITKYLCTTWKDHETSFLVVEPDGTTTGEDLYSSRKCAPAACRIHHRGQGAARGDQRHHGRRREDRRCPAGR